MISLRGLSRMRVGVAGLSVVLALSACVAVALAQGTSTTGETVSSTVTVRGRVLNKMTGEPIPRVLVTTPGDEYATMSDDRGQFELKIVQQQGVFKNSAGVAGGYAGSGGLTGGPLWGITFMARKPGFLDTRGGSRTAAVKDSESEVTIYLVPEALVVGHVNVPGTEGEVRIECELYRRRMNEGMETWQPAGTFTTWANGEFRFSGLEAGTYRLITHEQMDRDSLQAGPGEEMFGYPPIYYPNTTDFSLASPIVVKAGETAQANLTVERRAYYPVQIPVGNAPAAMGGGANVQVYPMGHWGPGWSLGYNPMELAIGGLLPNGNYTVELDTFGEPGSSGTTNFAVRGSPFEGGAVRLAPNASVTVNIRTEFPYRPGNVDAGGGAEPANTRLVNIAVRLSPAEQSGPGLREYPSRSVEGTNNRTLMIDNVKPGRYRVRTYSGDAYVASMESGGTDLMNHALVVAMGGAVPPIEITLRDDGAEVSGTVEEAGEANGNAAQDPANSRLRPVYLVPVGQESWKERQIFQAPNGTFRIPNVAPGEYLALAYQDLQPDLPFGDPEFVKRMATKGQMIHVDAGEKVNVKLKMLAASEEE